MDLRDGHLFFHTPDGAHWRVPVKVLAENFADQDYQAGVGEDEGHTFNHHLEVAYGMFEIQGFAEKWASQMWWSQIWPHMQMLSPPSSYEAAWPALPKHTIPGTH